MKRAIKSIHILHFELNIIAYCNNYCLYLNFNIEINIANYGRNTCKTLYEKDYNR
jgi:hypothetical protein